MTYGHEQAWLILALISFNAAFVRHYFNLKHQGQHKPWILVAGLVFLFAIIGYMLPKPVDMTDDAITDAQVVSISQQRCASCHALKPTQAGFAAAPAGIALENIDQLNANKPRILQAVQTQYMPLANMTNMTEQERSQMIRWATEE